MNSHRKSKKLPIYVIVILTLIIPLSLSAQTYEPGLLFVEMEEGYSIEIVNSQFGTSTIQYLNRLRTYMLDVDLNEDLEELALKIDSLDEVKNCNPNYYVIPLQSVQGSLPMTDLIVEDDYSNQRAIEQLNLTPTHNLTTGAGIKIAVIDGGINYLHPELSGSVFSGYDYVDVDSDAFDEPGGANSGHGTFIAGIIHLVAPDAEIWSYRVTDTAGASDGYLVAEAIMQAVDDGCRIINLSMVMSSKHFVISNAITYARQNGTLVITAAGNGISNPAMYPASDFNVIAVAALDSANNLADFSSVGNHIDICAPGLDICSPYLDSTYALWSGTSFSAPFVSGHAALLMSYRTDISSYQVKYAIIESGFDISYINPQYESLLGEGLMDIQASMLFDSFICGDLAGDGFFSIIDFTTYFNWIFLTDIFPVDFSINVANVNNDIEVDVVDMIYYADYLFQGGFPLCQSGQNNEIQTGGEVVLDHVDGATGSNSIGIDQEVVFNFKLKNNSSAYINNISCGFKFQSSDETLLSNVSISLTDNLSDMSNFIDVIYSSPMTSDNLGFLGLNTYQDFLSPEQEIGFISISVGPFGFEDIGKTITLDTTTYGRGGKWLWFENSQSIYAPDWSGPYTFTIEEATYLSGDINNDGEIRISDITYLVEFLFNSGPEPVNFMACDVNSSCDGININDLTYLVEYFFQNGNDPTYGCD